MKRLLIVINTMGYGGAETQTLELANSLVDLGYIVDIAVLTHKLGIIDKARQELCFHKMNKRAYLDLTVVRRLKVIIQDKNPDIILCVDLYPAMYVRLALGSMIKSCRVATVFHSTLPQNFKEKLQRRYLVPLANSMTQLIFVSKNQMEYWTKDWKTSLDKAVVIHNGINLDWFKNSLENKKEIQAVKDKYGIKSKDIVIGTCSNFRREKRHSDLIQAYARLKEKGYPVKLLLIGDGYMRPALEEQIHSLGLEKDAIISGFIADVRPYLAVVDIFTLTSDAVETLSIAAIESQAMKKAVVLSNIGGASEIVNDGENGFLYPAGDVESLIEKLEIILQEKKWDAMGEAGYIHARKLFHKDRMVKSYDRLFQCMVAGFSGSDAKQMQQYSK